LLYVSQFGKKTLVEIYPNINYKEKTILHRHTHSINATIVPDYQHATTNPTSNFGCNPLINFWRY